MVRTVDLYNGAYGNFEADVLSEIRRETYGEDLGQSSWITSDEYDQFCGWLGIDDKSVVLETACGSGGPALYLARKFGCVVTGIDINHEGVDNANRLAKVSGISNASFKLANVDKQFRFDDETFDAVICIDAANHFPNRLHVLPRVGSRVKAWWADTFYRPGRDNGAGDKPGIVRSKQYRDIRFYSTIGN